MDVERCGDIISVDDPPEIGELTAVVFDRSGASKSSSYRVDILAGVGVEEGLHGLVEVGIVSGGEEALSGEGEGMKGGIIERPKLETAVGATDVGYEDVFLIL